MRDEKADQQEGDQSIGKDPDPEAVESRAEGRPPEEASSDNPKAQAKAILEESEARMAERSTKSEP